MHLKVFVIDSVGAHRGMHYYNFALVSALSRLNAGAELISTLETVNHTLRPVNVKARAGFTGIYSGKSKWFRGLRYTLSLARIAFWAYRARPDIVHFHFYQVPTLDYVLLRVLQALDIKTVTTVHDVLPFERGTDFLAQRGKIFHRLYANSSGLILNSQHARGELAKLDPALIDKSVLIAQGGYPEMYKHVSLTPEEARARINLKPSTEIVLVFGTIKPNKRLDLVIRAMVDVVKRYPQSQLVIAGKLQDRDITGDMALAEELGVAANVVWRQGYVTDEELACYFCAANVVVFPYQWIYQSAALLMAMSFGKAIVATAVGSNKDIIKNNETGILVPLDDPRTMAIAILRVLDDEGYAAEIGGSAYEYVVEELSWDKIASATLDFYHQILWN